MAKLNQQTFFRYCATYYLWQWLSKDKELAQTLSANEIDQAILVEALTWYKVIRTTPVILVDNDIRCSKFAETLQNYQRINGGNGGAVKDVVELETHLAKIYDNSVLSALSKTAWLRWRDDFIIYDKRALTALYRQRFASRRAMVSNYSNYYDAWQDFYKSNQKSIDDAAKWLPNSNYAQSVIAHGDNTKTEIRNWAKEQWFKNRIADIALFHIGGDEYELESNVPQLPPENLARHISAAEIQ